MNHFTSNHQNRLIKWLVLLVSILTVYAASLATISVFNSPRLGYVNSSTLLEKYPPAISAREKIKKQTEEWQQNLKALELELGQLNQDLIENNQEWDKATRKSKQEDFAKRQKEFLRYNHVVKEKAAKLEQELMQPVLDELNHCMKEFGDEHGYDLIFGTVTGGNILYAQRAVDLTDQILTYISKKG
ncbi:MAG: OmpH family outer membrane protein [bacterium]